MDRRVGTVYRNVAGTGRIASLSSMSLSSPFSISLFPFFRFVVVSGVSMFRLQAVSSPYLLSIILAQKESLWRGSS